MSERVFENKNGQFREGDPVSFDIENPNTYWGDKFGRLKWCDECNAWHIDTKRGGLVEINKWLGAYSETIRKISESELSSLQG